VEQESSLATTYTWRAIPNTKALGGSYTTERLAGARASYPFTGTSVIWYTVLGPDQGTASVTIDGISHGTVNNYRRTVVFGAWRTFSGLSAGTHTLQIVVTGVRGSRAGTGTFVSIDGMRSPALQRTPSLSYKWRIGPYAGASGGHYAISDQKGSAVSFNFRGTSISWYTLLGAANGKAVVFIDGVNRGTFDTYRSSAIIGRATISGLTDAIHTIKIVNAGIRSAASHGTYITVDRFVVG
jgi:bacillopeptidase F